MDMDPFKDREKGFEAKFAHDLELGFLARVRAHFQTGLWAAKLLGKRGAEAEAYAESVRIEDFRGHGTDAVAAKLEADLAGRASRREIEAKLAELRARAERDLKGPTE